jgi:hypothetical protein
MSHIDWRAGAQLERSRHIRSDQFILVAMSQTIGMKLVSLDC